MSIACFSYDTRSSLDRVKRPLSPRRLAANRRNAKRSTGPRTPAGKKRVSRNALKHGLCAEYSCLPSESDATFRLFISELEQELQPRTIMQRTLFPQIANLIWRLDRMPEAQTRLFLEESAKARRGRSEQLHSSEVLARRFSDEPTKNGFLLMGRYERAAPSLLLRLLKQFEYLKKHHATAPYAPDEPPVPTEGSQPAWSKEKEEAQKRYFESDAGKAELRRIKESVDRAADQRARHLAAEAEAKKQTQSNPPKNRVSKSPAGNSPSQKRAPVTKQSHSHPSPPALSPSDPPNTMLPPNIQESPQCQSR